jgi:hypothetical protein
MVTNAPYYQMRPGQSASTPSSANAMPSHMAPEDDEYDPSAAHDDASSHEHDSASFPRHTVRQPSADTSVNTLEENHNLAELLEAATTAAGQAAQAMDAHDALAAITERRVRGGRKRVSSPPAGGVDGLPRSDTTIASKRRRVDVPTDPQLQSTQHEFHGTSKSTSVPPSGESLLNDARAAGVHSAAALFRRTSEKTTARKYTRPPMSKLFMSLQLSPENFLQLQAQAKTYMLDTTYPERQNCVGNRGKGDTDMVKLRLFNCVRDFLNDGSGEQFFGENVEKPGERDAMEAARALGEDTAPSSEARLTWPRDGNKIISLVTPLMRRMVTNERQRMYAIETRKGGYKKKDKEGSVEAQQVNSSPSGQNFHGEQPFAPAFDPTLGPTSQPTSPVVSTPITPGQTPVINMARLNQTVELESPDATNLAVGISFILNSVISMLTYSQLPTDGPAEPSVGNINIFLVTASRTMPSNTVKPGVKIDQTRISSETTHHIIRYSWADFLQKVIKLLKRAKARYPEIRERIMQHGERSLRGPTINDNLDNVTDNLRELAAAANAMQGENVIAGMESQKPLNSKTTDDAHPSTYQPLDTVQQAQFNLSSVADSEHTSLPRYTIRTVGPNGWEHIENAEQWSGLLLRRGHEVWADGVVNMIVEMVDVPVGVGTTEGRKDEDIVEIGGDKSN